MSGREAYKKFLKSQFWLELSSNKKALVDKCERCGSREFLECHHLFYRPDWYDTKLEDLEVLCKKHHRKAHGYTQCPRGVHGFMIYRDDVVFSGFLHRCHCLITKMVSGRGLRLRDETFLDLAERTYPASKKDQCMTFHVEQVRMWWVKFQEGRYQ